MSSEDACLQVGKIPLDYVDQRQDLLREVLAGHREPTLPPFSIPQETAVGRIPDKAVHSSGALLGTTSYAAVKTKADRKELHAPTRKEDPPTTV